MVRVTLQALAAVLGGCQSLHTNSRDEALALPTEESVRLALRTQQIIAHESGVCDTIDPLGGSYFIESMTDEVEQRVWEYIKKIDELGGAINAIEQQYFQTQITESAYTYQMAIERKEKIVVGVNDYVVTAEESPRLLRIDEEVRARQIGKLNEVKARRSAKDVAHTLSQLQHAARGDDNVIPPMLAAVEAYASVGEISDALREVWGVYDR